MQGEVLLEPEEVIRHRCMLYRTHTRTTYPSDHHHHPSGAGDLPSRVTKPARRVCVCVCRLQVAELEGVFMGSL